MNKIIVTLMGSPIVQLNNVPVHFSYRKVAGFFFYLCVKKQLTREEAISIFWADQDEKSARKNLRDVIYKLKKLLGDEVIFTVGNASIELNHQLVKVDVDQINAENIIRNYTGEFLHYFFIKECIEFETWSGEIQRYYRELYLSELYKYLCLTSTIKDVLQISQHANMLIQNNIYDERMYREIMRIYSENGFYNLAIKLYYELKEIVNEDLGELPDKNTQELLNKIVELKEIQSNNTKKSDEYFFGRYEELFQVHSTLNQFLSVDSASIIISGEAGVGKTTFLKKIVEQIDQEEVFYLPYVCHYAEKDFYLKSWHNLLRKMELLLDKHLGTNMLQTESSQALSGGMNPSTHDFSEMVNDGRVDVNVMAVHDALVKLTDQKKVVMVIDDIQWLDSASLNLLNMLLFSFGKGKLLIIAAHREDYQEVLNPFIITLEKENLIKRMYLNRFTFDEVSQIVSDLIPSYKNDVQIIRKIYRDTEGNSLFLLELIKIIEEKGYISLLSSKSVNIIQSRLIDLTDTEQSVLNALSLFPNKASMADLKIFHPAVELEIFETLEKLMEKKIIGERVTEGEVFYSFNHQWIREYVRDRQSLGKRKALNEKVARFYEAEYQQTGNKNLYAKMSYHFGECGDVYKNFYYKIEYLNDYYYNYHEIYPHVYSHMLPEAEHHDNRYHENSAELENLVQQIENLSNRTEEYVTLKMRLYFIMGRYYFYIGNYKEGLEKIDASIQLAIELGDYLYIYNNYKQKTYYGIQTADMAMMKDNLELCKKYLDKIPYSAEEKASVLRLQGLYLIEMKQYVNAENVLNETIGLLTANQLDVSEDNNLIDLAVCYSYLGRSHLLQKNYKTAYEFFLKAIELSGQKYVTNAVAVFYAEAAQALYEMELYTDAKNYIQQANYYFSCTHALWGKAKAQMYAALIELKLGNIDIAKDFFNQTTRTSEKLCNPTLNQQIDALRQEFSAYFN